MPRTPPPAIRALRQAYAEPLGLDRFTPWQKSVAALHGGHRAEVNVLTDGVRRVELVFLNTAMHTRRAAAPGCSSLWRDRRLVLRTVVADNSSERAGSYTYESLIDVLAGLLEEYRPTVVHTSTLTRTSSSAASTNTAGTVSSAGTPTTPTTPRPGASPGRP